MKKTDFQKAVYDMVKMVPKGKVSTYGRIAAVLGYPRAAQAVGWTLHWSDLYKIPAWRIVNRNGGLARGYSRGGREGHKQDLEKEGIEVDKKYCVDMEKYLWEFPKNLVINFRKKTKTKLENLPYQ